MKAPFWRFAAFLSVLACTAVACGSWTLRSGYVRTEDRNHDGRPDLWRFYDAAGQLRRTLTDTNFDGASDTADYYEHGAVARRVVDRNFDRQADRDDEFDWVTHERVRSVVDVDFDGRADLLVLFQDGKAVQTTWASDLPTNTRRVMAPDGDPTATTPSFAPMLDPFRGTAAFRAVHTIAPLDSTLALTSTGGLPIAPVRAGPPARTSTVGLANAESFASRSLRPSPTRGPPSASLI